MSSLLFLVLLAQATPPADFPTYYANSTILVTQLQLKI
jgi:hypothetical protein